MPVNVPAIPGGAGRKRALRPCARRVHGRGPRAARSARRGRAAGRSSSTRSATSRRPLQVKLLRALQERRAAARRREPRRVRSTCASFPRPRATWRGTSRPGASARTSSTASTSRSSACRRCASAARDALLLARHFLERYAREYGGGPLALAAEAAAAIARLSAGRATCASCRTRWRRRRRSATRRGLRSRSSCPEACAGAPARGVPAGRLSRPRRRAPARPDRRRARPCRRKSQPRRARSGAVAPGAAVPDQGTEGGGVATEVIQAALTALVVRWRRDRPRTDDLYSPRDLAARHRGPVMVGPSSSHTAGACRLSRVARALLEEEPVEARFELHSAFAKTMRGHGTDRALVAGTLGMEVDDARLKDALEIARGAGPRLRPQAEEHGAGGAPEQRGDPPEAAPRAPSRSWAPRSAAA